MELKMNGFTPACEMQLSGSRIAVALAGPSFSVYPMRDLAQQA
jgi:hypothetical protein